MTHSHRALYDLYEVQQPTRRFNPLVEAWFFFQNLAILAFVAIVDVEMYRRFTSLLLIHPDRVAEIAIVSIITVTLAMFFLALVVTFIVGETKYLQSIKRRGSE